MKIASTNQLWVVKSCSQLQRLVSTRERFLEPLEDIGVSNIIPRRSGENET